MRFAASRYLLAVVGVLALAGCSSSNTAGQKTPHSSPPSTSPTPFQITGTVTVLGPYSNSQNRAGTECWTLGNLPFLPSHSPFDDVKASAQVVVTDSQGKTLALGTLSHGTAIAAPADPAGTDCRFRFSVSAVPGGEKFYGVRVGGEQVVQFTAAAAPTAAITLGS